MSDYKTMIPTALKSLFWRGAWKLMDMEERRDLAAGYSMTSMELCLTRLARRGFQPTFVMDIGAYHGRWSEAALRAFGAAKVLMVEAQPGKAARLHALCNRYPGRSACEFALLGSAPKRAVPFYEMETGSSVVSHKYVI